MLNSNTTVPLQGWAKHYITREGWYAIKETKSNIMEAIHFLFLIYFAIAKGGFCFVFVFFSHLSPTSVPILCKEYWVCFIIGCNSSSQKYSCKSYRVCNKRISVFSVDVVALHSYKTSQICCRPTYFSTDAIRVTCELLQIDLCKERLWLFAVMISNTTSEFSCGQTDATTDAFWAGTHLGRSCWTERGSGRVYSGSVGGRSGCTLTGILEPQAAVEL